MQFYDDDDDDQCNAQVIIFMSCLFFFWMEFPQSYWMKIHWKTIEWHFLLQGRWIIDHWIMITIVSVIILDFKKILWQKIYLTEFINQSITVGMYFSVLRNKLQDYNRSLWIIIIIYEEYYYDFNSWSNVKYLLVVITAVINSSRDPCMIMLL